MAKGMFNDEYLVTARKWRPLQFKDIIGQEHVTQTLENAISSGKIHHAYLFSAVLCNWRGNGFQCDEQHFKNIVGRSVYE